MNEPRGPGCRTETGSPDGHIPPSPPLAVRAEADRLQRTGVDVVDLGAGEPDFPTPQPVKAAAKHAIGG